MTPIDHEFRIRFRVDESELEHYGSLFIACCLPDRDVCNGVKQIIAEVAREHPQAQFDGIIYHARAETA